jgi:hypothetical protein
MFGTGVAPRDVERQRLQHFSEELMKKEFQSIWSLGALALLLTVGISLSAQQSTQPTQPTDPTAQQPATAPQQAQPSQTPDNSGQQTPDSPAQTEKSTDNQVFTGTIVKSGDKYVLQDAASGNTYDIDHQEQLKEFEGKKVRVHGTLDADGKMIHLQ